MNYSHLFLRSIIIMIFFISSCNGTIDKNDSQIIEDRFDVYFLAPNDDIKNTINECIENQASNYALINDDSLRVFIECYAKWNVSNVESPLSIKIIEVDTAFYFMTITDSMSNKQELSWTRISDRPLLKAVKEILDTCTYSLYCLRDEEILYQKSLDIFLDSIMNIEIFFSTK